MRKQTNTLSPSPKCFQSPSPRTSEKSADSDSDVRKALSQIPFLVSQIPFLVSQIPICKMVSQILAVKIGGPSGKSGVRNVCAARLRDYFVFARLRDCTMGCLRNFK
jgi:hypothetical protein